MSRKKQRRSEYDSADNNPCMKERDLSFKCLEKNNYDRESCQLYFDNYNQCRKFWNGVESERSRKGIRPALPEPEERDRIKAEYLKKMKG